MYNVRHLENKFLDEIKKHIILALPKITYVNFRQSTPIEDKKLSFDMIFTSKFKISIRIRKHKYLYFNDLTIRSKSKNNKKTEIHKIMYSEVQIYFYAYMNEEEDSFVRIRIIDINAIKELTKKGKYKNKKNSDGTEFYTYLFSEIEKENGNIYKYDLNK